MKKTHTEFGDFAPRNGSRTLLEKVISFFGSLKRKK